MSRRLHDQNRNLRHYRPLGLSGARAGTCGFRIPRKLHAISRRDLPALQKPPILPLARAVPGICSNRGCQERRGVLPFRRALKEGTKHLPLDHQRAMVIDGDQARLEPAPHGIAMGRR